MIMGSSPSTNNQTDNNINANTNLNRNKVNPEPFFQDNRIMVETKIENSKGSHSRNSVASQKVEKSESRKSNNQATVTNNYSKSPIKTSSNGIASSPSKKQDSKTGNTSERAIQLKFNLDDISMKFEENINKLLQKYVISQRQFEEKQEASGLLSDFRESMKRFSNEVQMETDLYIRNVERCMKNPELTQIIGNQKDSAKQSEEKNPEIKRTPSGSENKNINKIESAAKVRTPRANTPNEERLKTPLLNSRKAETPRPNTPKINQQIMPRITTPIVTENKSNIPRIFSSKSMKDNKEKNSSSHLNSRLKSQSIRDSVRNDDPRKTDSQNINNKKDAITVQNFNNKLSSASSKQITLDKMFTYETFKSYEVDESIENWKETIERLHQNQELMKYALSRYRKSFKTYNELKEFLITPLATNESEKAWLVYLWVTHNIEYDVNAFKQNNHIDATPHSVFLQGSTVAAGYSSLYKNLCEHLNLKCSHIKGYAKGFSYEFGKSLYHENHDWNAVRISNKVYLVECTWGAGYVTTEHKFKKKFQPYYFCTPPHVFIEQHYSENFQYQTQKLSFDSFYKLAFRKLEFFLLGLDCLNANSTNMEYTENPIQLIFSTTSNIHLAANLISEKREKLSNCVLIQKNYETLYFEINVMLPDKNQYSLEIFALNESKNQYSFICKYYLKTKTMLEKQNKWCQSYQMKKNIYLFQPLHYQIDANRNYSFKLYADVENVVLIDSKENYFYFEKIAFEKNVWYLERSQFLKGKLEICVKYDDDETFWTCFTYIVA